MMADEGLNEDKTVGGSSPVGCEPVETMFALLAGFTTLAADDSLVFSGQNSAISQTLIFYCHPRSYEEPSSGWA